VDQQPGQTAMVRRTNPASTFAARAKLSVSPAARLVQVMSRFPQVLKKYMPPVAGVGNPVRVTA